MNPYDNNNFIATSTNKYLVPQLIDTVLRGNEFFGEVLANTKDFYSPYMEFPIKYQTGVPGVFFSGFDVLPQTFVNTNVNMVYYPKFFAVNVALAGSDLSVNEDKMQTMKIATLQMESRAQDMADAIGTYFYGDGSAFAGKAFNGLTNLVSDGTTPNSATIGGLSRALYPTLQGTLNNSFGTLTLLNMRQTSNAISDGGIQPNYLLADYNTVALVEQLYLPFMRMNTNLGGTMSHQVLNRSREGLIAETGYRALVWDGIPVIRDRKCPAGNLYFLNLNYLKFYSQKWYRGSRVSLKSKYIKANIYEEGKDAGNAFTWTNWIEAINMGAVNGFIIMGGEFMTNDPRRQGLLYGITNV